MQADGGASQGRNQAVLTLHWEVSQWLKQWRLDEIPQDSIVWIGFWVLLEDGLA